MSKSEANYDMNEINLWLSKINPDIPQHYKNRNYTKAWIARNIYKVDKAQVTRFIQRHELGKKLNAADERIDTRKKPEVKKKE